MITRISSPTPYVMPRREGQTFRDYLRAATEAGADFVLVTSWNEWPETTMRRTFLDLARPIPLSEDSGGMEGKALRAAPIAGSVERESQVNVAYSNWLYRPATRRRFSGGDGAARGAGAAGGGGTAEPATVMLAPPPPVRRTTVTFMPVAFGAY